jgi:hypothetical protein
MGKVLTDLPSRLISRTARSLSAHERSLVEMMREHQFGRIENMSVRAGQPVLDGNVRVVRIAKLDAKSGGTKLPTTDDFELKKRSVIFWTN